MNNKEILVELITQELVGFIMTDRSLEIDKAMKILYESDLFGKLQDTETGLYLEGSAYVYEILKDEMQEKAV
ncbi:MAG: hypothetical protein LBH09_06970 [Peptococcaceae bacterium]|jgi:hypothetical protein|nr:hypothetical protein [Peptococcaceae bacterium]